MKKLIFLLVIGLLIPAALNAVPKEDMVWKSSGQKRNQAKIEKGIEKAIDDMNFITRPIARGKLKKANIAFKTIQIKFTGEKVSIQQGARTTIAAPVDGGKVSWTREDGDKFKVSQKVSETKITQVFQGENGKKTLVYKFNKEFTEMWVSVRVDSPKLPEPVRYTLKYKR